jgi:uncharacterized protein
MNALVEPSLTTAQTAPPGLPEDLKRLKQSIDAACKTVAPTWPLDQFIAVNPYWGFADRPIEQAAALLDRLAASPLWMPAQCYRDAWEEGLFGSDDLRQAAAEAGIDMPEKALLETLALAESPCTGLALLSDFIDLARDPRRMPLWRDTITTQISQFCAAYFDRHQADWHAPTSSRLFCAWRAELASDPGVALLMGEPAVAQRAKALPDDPLQAIAQALSTLQVPGDRREMILLASLMRINGWAAWCAYRRWQARLVAADDDTLIDLLAIRLCWEQLLDDGQRSPSSIGACWLTALMQAPPLQAPPGRQHLGIFQRAIEIHYQRGLARSLGKQGALSAQSADTAPAIQAAFCIDVRSEVFRRALESVDPGIQTLGFAGFFGLPIRYTPLGTDASRPQLPGILAPSLEVLDSSGSDAGDRVLSARRKTRLGLQSRLQLFSRAPSGGFAMVETLGLTYLGSLIRRERRTSPLPSSIDQAGLEPAEQRLLRPALQIQGDDALEQKTALAERILKAMSLTRGFARLVALVGHGSQSANNAHASGLDCGACCGQTGEVNARTLARLLNEANVRTRLGARGLAIDAPTVFVAALHNTTTDEVALLDLVDIPASHARDLAALKAALDRAGARARAERASDLGLAALADKPQALLKAVRRRASDWAQTRPEWGLANNAALIAAPRRRTRALDLRGRAFLHDYAWDQDTDGSVLELIMTAPMVVAHWINMQYNASTVDQRRYGSGNKLLHNVVGGHIGVFEGNGGDLRIGLPRQSVHDGVRWMHTPQRLSVFIEAPCEALGSVIARHELIRQLLDHRWLFLFGIDPGTGEIRAYRNRAWQALA